MDVLQHAPALTPVEAAALALVARRSALCPRVVAENVIKIRPPMPFTRDNAAPLVATLGDVLTRHGRA